MQILFIAIYIPIGLSRPESRDEFIAAPVTPPPPFSRALKLRSFGTAFKLLLFPFVDEAVLLDDVIPLSLVWLRLFWLVTARPTVNWLNLPLLLLLLFVIKLWLLLLFVAPPIVRLFCLLMDRIEPEEEHSSRSPPTDPPPERSNGI